MVKPQRIEKPLPLESKVQSELTGLDQLTDQERQRIEARKAGAQGQVPLPVSAPAEDQLLDHTDRDVSMTRRSWYVTQEASDALAAAVDDIHFATRAPKHAIASALFKLAASNGHLVERTLGRPAQQGS
jgi:hypothetical protein